MNKCIYKLQGPQKLTFNKEEHIFPKGIGGVTVLSKGIVSDEANEGFSLMELNFMRHSIINLPRVFFGPGKRGKQSNNVKKQSKSKVSIFEDFETKELSLGYIAEGKPYSILQIKASNIKKDIKIKASISTINKGEIMDNFATFNKIFKKIPKLTLIDERIPKDSFILGMDHKKKLYLAISSNSCKIGIEKIINQLDFNPEIIIGEERATQKPKITLKIDFDEVEFSRILFKIAYNVLAYELGSDFIKKTIFNDLREFILNGLNKDKIYSIIADNNNDSLKYLNLDEKKHAVIIMKTNKQLGGVIYIYGFKFLLNFGIEFNDNFNIVGRVCYWENRKEMR